MKTVALGSGSAGGADRLDGAIDVVARGDVDYVCFDTLSEMTLKTNIMDRQRSTELGYDPFLDARIRGVLPPAVEHETTLIGNFGGINPIDAARRTAEIACELGYGHLRIAAVTGDDVTAWCQEHEDPSIVFAQAYVGGFPVAQALAEGADIVVTGRVADSALYLGALIHEFGWDENDLDQLGAGTVIGHLLECGALATGALWTDGVSRPVPNLARVGLPIADVREDVTATLRKPPGTGGVVRQENFRAQLMHEINDPARYLVPDVTANLLSVTIDQAGDDTVEVGWLDQPRGTERPVQLKALAARHDGFLGEALLFLPGPNAKARAQMIEAVARERFDEVLGLPLKRLRFDYIGDDTYRPAGSHPAGADAFMVLRIAGVSSDKAAVDEISRFGEHIAVVGPLGLGEHRQRVAPLFGIDSVMVDRSLVDVKVRVERADGGWS